MGPFGKNSSRGRGKKKVVEKTRKELRKEKRKDKKKRKAEYFGKKKIIIEDDKNTPGKFVLNPHKAPEETKKKRTEKAPKKIKKDELQIERENEERERKTLDKEMNKNRKRRMKEANAEEDKVIKQLEKRLKLNKRKAKGVPKSFVEDGLDYLLDFCDEENRKIAVETEKQFDAKQSSKFEEDFAIATGRKVSESSDDNFSDDEIVGTKQNSGKSKQSGSEEDDDFSDLSGDFDGSEQNFSDDIGGKSEGEESLDEEETQQTSNSKINKQSKSRESDSESELDDELSEGDFDEEMSENDSVGDENSEHHKVGKDGSWEDIYGRKRDKSGNVVQEQGKYIPPGARKLSESTTDSEKLLRLRKQLKGLINRLAEHNMHMICNQVEDIYMSNSRNDVNEMLTKLTLESLVSPVTTADRLISEHVMLIAILHANVGTEVGAHFLMSLVKKFDELLKKSPDVEDKELDNIVAIIAHLYNFKVYGAQLLYQILKKISEKFTEKEIELILLILKTVGFLLRKDDPASLKELILNLQQRALNAPSTNARIKFMLDVLLAIKNNNMKKIPQYDPTHVEHLKKVMKPLIRKGNSVTQFNITLEDLLQVDEKGKWWVVGSAWAGNTENVNSVKTDEKGGKKTMFSAKLLELARKQRMNTDIRKDIFCILMSAEDYLDAFEKLHHLGLSERQGREIIHVILSCCLQEKNFNPYYAVLAQKFCDYDRKYQMTIQYSLWDKLQMLQNHSSNQLTNLSKFLTHLFIGRGLPLSVLKVVQFGELDKHLMRLLRQILLGILLHEDDEAVTQVFSRISASPQLQTFREGLRLFISHFLVKGMKAGKIPEEHKELLNRRAEVVDKLLAASNSKLLF